MTGTYTTNRDEMMALCVAALRSPEVVALLTYSPEIRTEDSGGIQPPDGNKIWFFLSAENVYEQQWALATNVVNQGQRRYSTDGVFMCEGYSPVNLPNSKRILRQVCEIVRNAFRGAKTANGVWFRNSRISEQPMRDATNRINVVTEYFYTEVN